MQKNSISCTTNNPLFVARNGEVDRRLVAVRDALHTEKMARESAKLQSLVEGQNGGVLGNVDVALGVIEADGAIKDQEESQHVMNWSPRKY